MRGLIADADAAVIADGTRPGADDAAAGAAFEFIFGLFVCAPGQLPPSIAGPPTGTPQADGPQLWRYDTGGWVVNAPTMANGAIYVGSDDHYVYSLDAQTGALRWRFETGDVIRSSPTVTGGAVYVGSNDNHVYALDAGTGALLWKHDTGGWVQYSPVVSGGRVYLGARSDGDYKVHALDALSGAQVWVAAMPYPVGSEFTVTIADGKLYGAGCVRRIPCSGRSHRGTGLELRRCRDGSGIPTRNLRRSGVHDGRQTPPTRWTRRLGRSSGATERRGSPRGTSRPSSQKACTTFRPTTTFTP